MSTEVYAVTLPSGASVYVAAKSKAAAKKFAIKDVDVRRLSGSEVIALNEAGKAIGSAESDEQ